MPWDKAHRHMTYDSKGLLPGFIHAYLAHINLFNFRCEPGEHNVFEEVVKGEIRAGIHEKDARFGRLGL